MRPFSCFCRCLLAFTCVSRVLFRCLADGLNLNESVAKLLVDYVDALLRKGGLPQPPEESEVEGRLDDLIQLCEPSKCSSPHTIDESFYS